MAVRRLTESSWYHTMPGVLETDAPEGYKNTCRTCKGAEAVYEDQPYYMFGKLVGYIPKWVPCPACSAICETCGGTGTVRYDLPLDHADYGKLFPCPDADCRLGQDMHIRMQRALMTSANVPEQYKGMTFASFDAWPDAMREGKRLARAAAELFVAAAPHEFMVDLDLIYGACQRPMPSGLSNTRRNSLVFQGPVGVGKTGLAASIANALADTHQHKLMYIRVRDLIARIQSAYANDHAGPSADMILRDVMDMPLLILDEMNLTQTSADRQDILETLIRHRYGNQLPTVITLNDDQDGLELQWGLRTATAIRGMAHWLRMGGPELRDERPALEVW